MKTLSNETENRVCELCGENHATHFDGNQYFCSECWASICENEEEENEKETAFENECNDRQESVLHIEEVLERNGFIYDKIYSNGTSVYFEVQANDLDIKVRLADHCVVYDADLTVAYKGFENQNVDATSLDTFENVLLSYISKNSK